MYFHIILIDKWTGFIYQTRSFPAFTLLRPPFFPRTYIPLKKKA